MKREFVLPLIGCLGLALVAGCTVPEPELHTPARREKLTDFVAKADAGIKVDPMVTDIKKLADMEAGVPRGNPFSLKSNEAAFERDQRAANLLQTVGGFYRPMYEEPDEPLPPDSALPLEPQPARRLVGIMRGETVTALIDMGDGTGIQTIYPGAVIEPSKVWRVESIDDEKAILTRVNRNARPFTVVVRLSPNLGGASGGGNTGGGFPGGNQGGGDSGGDDPGDTGGRRGGRRGGLGGN